MSEGSLASIVDQSISELRRLREETGEQRLKIIASALNYDHCIQITEAFRARGLRAAYVHSREAQANERVFQQLENHELDAIVQARMLGEGFDHPHLAVAMVGSIFASLSPFVQFVGRIMRLIQQDAPGHPLNQGVVVFHAGVNVARRWDDFRHVSLLEDGLQPLNVRGEKYRGARDAVMVFVAFGFDRQATLTFLDPMVLIVSAVVATPSLRPFHADNQRSRPRHAEALPRIVERSRVTHRGRR